jgi:L-gulonolactone oxidase
MLPTINRLYNKVLFSRRKHYIDTPPAVLNFDCLFPQYTAEFAIPIENTNRALTQLKHLIESEDLKVNFPVEVRFTGRDDFYLSPCYGRDTCWIGVVMYRPYLKDPVHYKRYLQGFAEIMEKLEGRPHWAKDFSWKGPEKFKKIYPEYNEFLNIKK